MPPASSSRAVPDAFARLSAVERAQLGTHKPLQNGTMSAFRYVPAAHWALVRSVLLARSRASAARGAPDLVLPDRMTAYTPGETLHLLQEPEVQAWHRRMATFAMPATDALGRPYQAIAFVPCAKTKPWDTATAGLYGAYNAVRAQVRAGQLPPVYFVTLSEPLGVVPEDHWGDFPPYDNPGLFTNEVLRAGGLFTADWATLTPAAEKFIIPFDPAAARQAIATLGAVIARFMAHIQQTHPHLTWLAFVDERVPALRSTHTAMLDHALAALPALRLAHVPHLQPAHRHPKKAAARVAPLAHVTSCLAAAHLAEPPRASRAPRPALPRGRPARTGRAP